MNMTMAIQNCVIHNNFVIKHYTRQTLLINCTEYTNSAHCVYPDTSTMLLSFMTLNKSSVCTIVHRKFETCLFFFLCTQLGATVSILRLQ